MNTKLSLSIDNLVTLLKHNETVHPTAFLHILFYASVAHYRSTHRVQGLTESINSMLIQRHYFLIIVAIKGSNVIHISAN